MMVSLEELLQAAVDARAVTDDAQWRLGAICVALHSQMCMKKGEIASILGCSAQRVTALIRTWFTFPEDGDRVAELTWKHHEVASRSDSPGEFLRMAADGQWSIREMSAALKAPKPEQEAAFERAARARNLVGRVLADSGEAAQWLRNKLSGLLA